MDDLKELIRDLNLQHNDVADEADLRRRNVRRRIRDEERQRRFNEAVERTVAERLAPLAVHI